MRPLLAAACCLALLLSGWAHATTDPAERARRVAERQALEQRFDAEERACAERFAVNACVDDVRARRRAALAPLREAELRLAEAERRRRADERRAEVRRKQQALASRPPAPPAATTPRLREAAPPPEPPPAPARDRRAAGRERAEQAAAEAARQAESLRQARERAAAAEARIRERRARQAARLQGQGRRPDTLPRPPAAASQPAAR